ncbi:MAG: hypothetical protein ASARMPRED_001190 [Alectoria sarmentosa]|nr:MAG: hypothetical protein ASARMPRED_001190 [Alectoria sarmentosa]
MAEAFLSQLPYVGRGILGQEDQRCSICMEDYGTAPSASGIIERAVKLPCNHILGSECISIWLSAPAQGGGGNNTCPICRRVLFPVQRRPPMPRWRVEHMRLHTLLVNRCVGISAQLGLDPDVSRMAREIAHVIHDRVRLERFEADDDPALAVAAASVYMASHLLGDARSLEMISSCVDVGDDAVRGTYNLLHTHRYEIINTQLLAGAVMEQGGIDEVLPPMFS